MWLLWTDDRKIPTAQKVAAGLEAYNRRFQARPAQVLVNEADLVEVPGVRVESRYHIGLNCFWIGPLVEAGRG